MTTTFRKAITALVLLIFLQVGDALKGNGLRRQRGIVAAANEPRALGKKNGGREASSQEVDLEKDDPVPTAVKKGSDKSVSLDGDGAELIETPNREEDLEKDYGPTELPDVSETLPKPKGRGKDGGKGDDGGSDAVEPSVSEPTTYENGIVLPGTDDYAKLPEQVPGGGLVQSVPSAPLTTFRELPMYAIRYIVKSDRTPNAGDYNELAIVTTEFLDENFAAVYQATPAKHAFTTVESYKIREPLVIEFHISSHFYIPGEVPLISYMYEKLEQQFDAHSQAQDKYMNELSAMSDTNPFSKVERIEIIDNRPRNGGPNLRSGNSDEQKKRTLILVPVVLIVTFFVLGIAFCLLFRRRKNYAKAGNDDDTYFRNGMETDNSSHEEGTIEEGTHTLEVPAMLNPNGTQYYGDDPETVRYLNSIRESGLEEASKLSCTEALEEVSLDDVSIEDDSSQESEESEESEESADLMVDASSVAANEDHPSMASDDAEESSNIENREILSRNDVEEVLGGKSRHAVEGNAPLLPHSEISEEATCVQNASDDDATGEAEQNKNDACNVVSEHIELQDEEASQGNGEGVAEPASTSNAAETTAVLPPNDRLTESFSKNDQDEFNYLQLDSSFEEDLRSVA